MNALIKWWASNPVAANLLMVGILITGALGYSQVEREVIPTIPLNAVNINIVWPGAAPAVIEEQVVIRIEEALSGIDHVDRITSSAEDSVATIVVNASPRADINALINNIKQQLDSISTFPAGMEKPLIFEDILRTPLMRLAVHGNVDDIELQEIAESLRREMALLPNVSIVELSGNRSQEVTIELSEESMRRYQLSFDDVSNAIRSSSINVSAGRVRTATGNVQLRSSNYANSQEDFNNIVIRQSEKGGVVVVGDVARVIDGFDDELIVSYFDGEPAALLEVLSSGKTDVVKTSKVVRAWLDQKSSQLPPNTRVTLWFDAAETYESRMNSLGKSAGGGLILVLLVLALSLRAKVALWVTIGIATTYAATFALLPASDVSINILSTFGFLLVLGIVIDDALVIGESIHELSDENGKGGLSQAVLGTQLVAKPVFFSVLTTMLAFLPWLFVSGEDALVLRHLSIVVVLALTFSLIEAFFILPAHLSKLDPIDQRSGFARLQQTISKGIKHFANTRIRRSTRFVVGRPYLVLSLFLGSFFVSAGLITGGWVKFSLTPEIDKDQVVFSVQMVDGTPYSRVLEVLEIVRSSEQAMVESIYAEQGNRDTPFILNRYAVAQNGSLSVTAKLATMDTLTVSGEEVSRRWRQRVGDIQDAEKITVVYNSRQEPSISYTISNENLDDLRVAINDFKQILRNYDMVFNIKDNLRSTSEEMRFSLLPGAQKHGLTIADVSRQVRQAYYGEEAQRIPRGHSDVRVMVRYPKSQRENITSLAKLHVRTEDGKLLPLLSVVAVDYMPGVSRIERKDRQRAAVVTAELTENVATSIQADLTENYLEDWKLNHPGSGISTEDDPTAGQKEFVIELMSLFLVAFFAIYSVIAIAFRSYSMPFIILMAIPFSLMGAIVGHFVYSVPMTLFSYFGIGAASGVIVNDNIVLLEYINRLLDKGLEVKEAVVEAAVRRFRPIFLTSLTTFVGLLPMMAERSVQARFMQPTVVSLAFGVAFAGIVTVLLMPALFMIRGDLGVRLAPVKWWITGRRPAKKV